jgi:hypothetical protein
MGVSVQVFGHRNEWQVAEGFSVRYQTGFVGAGLKPAPTMRVREILRKLPLWIARMFSQTQMGLLQGRRS